MRRHRLHLTGLLLILSCAMAQAQIVTGNANYAAGPPKTVTPSGTASANPPVRIGRPNPWQVVFDFGTITSGNFTSLPAVAAGGLPANVPIAAVPVALPAVAPVAWAVPAAVNLSPGWPAPGNIYLKITLQEKLFNVWTDSHTIYVAAP
jgi:hypothetical protein